MNEPPKPETNNNLPTQPTAYEISRLAIAISERYDHNGHSRPEHMPWDHLGSALDLWREADRMIREGDERLKALKAGIFTMSKKDWDDTIEGFPGGPNQYRLTCFLNEPIERSTALKSIFSAKSETKKTREQKLFDVLKLASQRSQFMPRAASESKCKEGGLHSFEALRKASEWNVALCRYLTEWRDVQLSESKIRTSAES